jgi:hypothetical protein
MAEIADDHQSGQMDVSEQVRTFHAFAAMTKWASLTIGALLVFLVMWFCTPAGFLMGLVAALVLVAVGVFFLRDKPADEH